MVQEDKENAVCFGAGNVVMGAEHMDQREGSFLSILQDRYLSGLIRSGSN